MPTWMLTSSPLSPRPTWSRHAPVPCEVPSSHRRATCACALSYCGPLSTRSSPAALLSRRSARLLSPTSPPPLTRSIFCSLPALPPCPVYLDAPFCQHSVPSFPPRGASPSLRLASLAPSLGAPFPSPHPLAQFSSFGALSEGWLQEDFTRSFTASASSSSTHVPASSGRSLLHIASSEWKHLSARMSGSRWHREEEL